MTPSVILTVVTTQFHEALRYKFRRGCGGVHEQALRGGTATGKALVQATIQISCPADRRTHSRATPSTQVRGAPCVGTEDDVRIAMKLRREDEPCSFSCC